MAENGWKGTGEDFRWEAFCISEFMLLSFEHVPEYKFLQAFLIAGFLHKDWIPESQNLRGQAMTRQVQQFSKRFDVEARDPAGAKPMLEGGEDHMCARDLGLVFLLVQRPIDLLRHLRDLPGKVRVAMLLDIAPTVFLVHADGAEYDQERGGGDPFLSVREFRDLFDQETIGDHPEHPRLLISTRWGETRGIEHVLDHFLGDRPLLELADTDTLFQ